MTDPQSYRPQNIPTEPGVYRFFDGNDQVIYVGKAKNLKNRLNSYFGSNLSPKTHRMVHHAVRVDWTIVKTELEALQLEFTWIKKENPRYNIQFRDDKSYPYLAISLGELFPRMYISRNRNHKITKYFGPYAHGWALRSTFEVAQNTFPIRTCTDVNFQQATKTKRACLLGHIGKCAAPCIGKVTVEEHLEIAKKLVKFLDTNPDEVKKELQTQMIEASQSEEFEKAARLRDQLAALEKSEQTAGTFLSEGFSGDFLAAYEEITHIALTVFMVRSGRIMGSRSWILDRKEILEEEGYLAAALNKIYLESEIPREILINELLSKEAEISLLENYLSEKAGFQVNLIQPQRGDKFELMQTVQRNAHEALVQYLSKRMGDSAVSGEAVSQLAQYLDLSQLPLRIECFDISNTQGTNMVASMVVFEDGRSKKSEYRRFSIDDEKKFDDTRAMNEVITRRFKRYLAAAQENLTEIEEMGGLGVSGAKVSKFAYPPQLIVVDGGQPQVNAAVKALNDLGITDIPIVGLAKRMEEVWLPGSPDPIILPRHSEALYLLQRIRDEAHRFAITFHRSKRSKVMLESALDEIDGLGEIRRKALLEHFGSLAAIKKATELDISKIPGIGEVLAKQIYDGLHNGLHDGLQDSRDKNDDFI